MTKSAKTGITVGISILLAIVLIWWAMRGLDLQKTWQSLQQANFYWILASFAMGAFAYFLRSERWKLLLKPMGYQISSSDSYYAVCMNYFWNLVIPRSGELARCTTLYSLDQTPIDKSFGTVITERIIDLICLGILALLTFIFKFDLILNLLSEVQKLRSQADEQNSPLVWLISTVFVVFLLSVFIFWNRIKKLSIFPKIKEFLSNLKQGIQSIFHMKKRGLFLFYTLGIWVLYYFMTYVVVFAIPETSHLSAADGLYLILVSGIGMVIPASGGFGGFHSAMRLGFITLGLSGELGLTFAFLVHTPHTLVALLSGLFAIVMISFKKSKSKN